MNYLKNMIEFDDKLWNFFLIRFELREQVVHEQNYLAKKGDFQIKQQLLSAMNQYQYNYYETTYRNQLNLSIIGLFQLISFLMISQLISYFYIQMINQKAFLVVNDNKINLHFQQTTVGRLTSNLIVINDPTISKNHASIHYLQNQNQFYLKDLNTINGTFLNGNKLQANKKYVIKHKDSIQFGKNVNLYNFYEVQPQNDKKGKINLKDYCFQLQSSNQNFGESNMKLQEKNYKSNLTIPKESKIGNKEAGKKLKIPNIEDFLQLSQSFQSSHNQQPLKHEISSKIPSKISKFQRQSKVELPNFSKGLTYDEVQKYNKQQQNRNNIFLTRQRQKQKKVKGQRQIQEQKIKLQIQKFKNEQQILRKRYQLQKKIKEQQERMEEQKQKMQEELFKREEERRSKQKQFEMQQKEKERRFIEQLQYEKENQLKLIKQHESSLRNKTQVAMKEQLQRKKKDLQLQAEALAKQYEQIYKQTIRKMKNDIQKQQSQIEQLQVNIQHLQNQFNEFEQKNKVISQAVASARQQLNTISGRNKAFILYASELQNKLQQLKSQRVDSKQKKINAKLKEQIINSRKLLFMKNNELKSLQDQINAIRLNLNLQSKNGHNQLLQTILDNHHNIQNYKNIYFEYLREEKHLKELWQQLIYQNQALEQQNFALQKEIQSNKKELSHNIRDNNNRLTEQRLHMLKCLHYLPEDKKRAAKFLIEEMVTMQEEIRGMIAESELSHDKIQQLIIDSQAKKRQNQYYSTLLFGSESTAHHFDNMKIQINSLIERVALQKDFSKINKRLKLSEDIMNNEMKIHAQNVNVQKIKNRWKHQFNSQKITMIQKHPIVFFGDLLTKKQSQLQISHERIAKTEREYVEVARQVQQLQKRRQRLNGELQKLKREELIKVRQGL